MPDILVEVKGSWLDGKETDFLATVHRGVAQALATPAEEPLVRLIAHPATHYLIPHSAGERFTRIEIILFAGRSLDAKRKLYRILVQHLRPFDVPPEEVKIVLIEVSSENVGFRGGQAACDVDLGYELQV